MRFFCGLFFIMLSCFCVVQSTQKQPLQSHEQYWQEYAGTSGFWPQLELWLQDFHTISRVKMREYVRQQEFKTILDVPCGVGTDYFGFLHDQIAIAYQGVELTPKLVSFCQEHGIPVIQGSIEKIPFEDNSFDIAYARHVLEHLSYYHTAINELIRVAKKEVLVVFFLPPRSRVPDKINLYTVRGLLLYNNWYNKELIELFSMKNEKVASVSWQKISSAECFLHIYLKN